MVPGQLNGLPVIRFAGGQFFALAGPAISSPAFTIVVVARDLRTDANFRELISNWDAPSGNQGTSVFFGTTGLNPVRARLSDDFGGADQSQTGVGVVAEPTQYFLLSGVNGPAGVAVYQNTTAIATRATPLTSRNLGGVYYVGRQGSGTFDEYWRGDIAEMLVYNRELSASELDRVWESLQLKYLPASAPARLDIESLGSLARVRFTMAQPVSYRLQASDTLTPALWIDLAKYPAGTTVSNVVLDYPHSGSQRFYRLQLGP